MSTLSVACVGLGRIGSGIAQSVQRAGHRLTVYNRTEGKTRPFAASGAMVARSPREAAAAADIVITCLMDDASVLDNMTGDDGLLVSMRPGAIHVGTSTTSPKASLQFATLHAARSSRYVAGPVAGRPDAAAAGKLITFVAGPAESIERSRPVIESYATRILVLGEDPALAASLKLVVNFFGASLLELFGESVVFAEKRGLNPELITGLLKEFLQHPAMPVYMDKIRTRNFDDDLGFTLEGAAKDVRLILESASEAQVPLPYASLIRDKMIAAQALGMGQRDWSVFTEIARISAGQKAAR